MHWSLSFSRMFLKSILTLFCYRKKNQLKNINMKTWYLCMWLSQTTHQSLAKESEESCSESDKASHESEVSQWLRQSPADESEESVRQNLADVSSYAVPPLICALPGEMGIVASPFVSLFRAEWVFLWMEHFFAVKLTRQPPPVVLRFSRTTYISM